MDEKIYFLKGSGKRLNAKVIYIEEDKSFSTKPIYFADLTLMTGSAYLGIDINLANMLLISVWGFCPKYCWIETELNYPDHINDGEIIIKTEIKLKQGVSIDLLKESSIYFCKENNLVCVGDKNIDNYDYSIRFMENAIISLKNNEFRALWIDLKDR